MIEARLIALISPAVANQLAYYRQLGLRSRILNLPLMVAWYTPTCVPPVVLPTVPPAEVRIAELWEEPVDLAERDLFYGPWGPERAPEPEAVYTFVETKKGGVNPGMTVRDPTGREW